MDMAELKDISPKFCFGDRVKVREDAGGVHDFFKDVESIVVLSISKMGLYDDDGDRYGDKILYRCEIKKGDFSEKEDIDEEFLENYIE